MSAYDGIQGNLAEEDPEPPSSPRWRQEDYQRSPSGIVPTTGLAAEPGIAEALERIPEPVTAPMEASSHLEPAGFQPCSLHIGSFESIAPHGQTVTALVALQGCGTLTGPARIDLVSGTLVWIASGTHFELARASRDWASAVVSFSRSFVEDQLGEASDLTSGEAYRCQVVPAEQRHGFSVLLRDISTQDETSMQLGLAYLLRRLWQQSEREIDGGGSEAGSAERMHPSVRRALGVLEQDPRLDISELARAVRTSPSHLTRLFKSQIGLAPGRVREQIRIERFLKNYRSETGLLESALACGFGSYAQFYRVFRRHTGLSPREYYRLQALG